MAEGPLVHRVARELRSVLKGKRAKVEFGLERLKPIEKSLRNVMVRDVEAYGKQFRIELAGDRIVLVHLMMWGWWRIYPKGKPWDRPRERARVVFRTATHEVVVFSAPVVRLFSKQELETDPTWGDLGPDPLRPDFSRAEFSRRLEAAASRDIGEVLLDQRVISGVGNILKIEILFGAGIHPHRRVAGLSRAEKQELLRWIFKLMGRWLRERGTEDQWIRIYRKGGKPCPQCGGTIEHFRQGGRITYACPVCQPLPRKARRPVRGSGRGADL